jgi:hypothetical protein
MLDEKTKFFESHALDPEEVFASPTNFAAAGVDRFYNWKIFWDGLS